MTDFVRLHRKDFDLKKFITSALEEDALTGDHTSLAIIPKKHSGKMKLLVKEQGIIAGVKAAELIIRHIDKKIRLKIMIKDGTAVKPGDIVFIASGNSRNLLLAERLVLNVMQRMSGIATKTNYFQSLCKGTKAKVTDTRKTTPGFRFFEKWAVLIGGGVNHRYSLSDMVLIKDNHIDFAGGITGAIDLANAYLKKKRIRIPIEVETRNIGDVKAVISHGGVKRIMLDNFKPADVKAAVKLIAGKFATEASGGITATNLSEYAQTGVDLISIGALTHHVKGLDMSLKAIS